MKCSKCGLELPSESKFCRRCGTEVEATSEEVSKHIAQKYCPVCGTIIIEGYRFCKNCRTPIEGNNNMNQRVHTQDVQNDSSKTVSQSDGIPTLAPPKNGNLRSSGETYINNSRSSNNSSNAIHGGKPAKSHTMAIMAVFGIVVVIVGGYMIANVGNSKKSEEQEYFDTYREDAGQEDSYTASNNDLKEADEEEYYNQNEYSSAYNKEEESEYDYDDSNTSDYILPESDSRYLSESELYGLSQEECKIARNELYARHGRKFKDIELQNYFNQFDWYYPSIDPDDFLESMLNSYEIANRDLLVEYEKNQGWR